MAESVTQADTLKTTPPVTSGNVITSDLLQPKPKVDIPTAQPSSPIAPTALNLAQQELESQLKDTQAQTAAQTLSTRIFNAIPELAGEKQALASEQEKAGVGRLKQELQNINSQILQKQAEIAQDDTKLIASMRAEERRDTLLPFAQSAQAKLQGDAQILRALKNSEIGVLNASVLAKQGDIALALQTAQQAVDVKYAPYKDQINTYKAQLEALEPILKKDDVKQANAQKMKADLALREIAKQEQKEKDLQSMLVNAASQNAPADILALAQKTKDPTQAAMILRQYAGDYYKTELLKQQIATEKTQRAKIAAEIQAKGTQAPVSDATSLQEATKNLKLTEAQSKALAFGQRAVNADKALRQRLQTYDPTTIFSATGRLLRTDNARAFERDLSDFITAVLRKESGATITEDEFARFIPLYSPQGILTNQEDVEQTNLKRDASINALISEAGPASAALSQYKKTVGAVEEVNPFLQAIGKSNVIVPGTSIINKVTDTGDIEFNIPK